MDGLYEQCSTGRLRLFTELGVLVHFSSDVVLRSMVVLDPQWLISALAEVIRDFDLHSTDVWCASDELFTQYGSDIEQMQKRGVVTKRLLWYLWREYESPTKDLAVSEKQTTTREFLLAVLTTLALANRLLEPGAAAEAEAFLVPSLLAVASTEGVGTTPDQERV